ncbi:H(+)-transporting V1 sector ATPase subunit F [Tulasnella sp. 330]|nr:H(+)-transporting V1 sector ATPase subunit F [Tulasnella sp. 330]KAG8890067.1 H(+)-transporting V1 sector ATPase subunit F [Tulasnella sp. 332]
MTTPSQRDRVLLAVIGDEASSSILLTRGVKLTPALPPSVQDTITGLLLAGIGNVSDRQKKNFLVVDAKTQVSTIESAFQDFTERKDIAILLINQHVAEKIRPTVDAYEQAFPALLEIPSKDHPYDPAKDSILKRVQKLFGDV